MKLREIIFYIFLLLLMKTYETGEAYKPTKKIYFAVNLRAALESLSLIIDIIRVSVSYFCFIKSSDNQ